ncbi:collagen alpha-3(VI) chain-like isoform X3 [Leucoraja erinacea]|uniref:collagen alpha-3(VI) chain-like isoform X3 n=1 Tax=Leucoraja erinaceus TaxID=7782 RepID=UPI002454B3BA|nr:collagen alpha-3(VI) chain-like isoform X3 [Leucoraja erinacea]
MTKLRAVPLLALFSLICFIRAQQAQESADLIFLIDGSASVGSVNFQYIRDFIVNFIDSLEIGPDRIQIGVVQYSDEPSTEFYLNTYSTKIEVLDAVKRLQAKGGDDINTGEAVQYIVDNHLIESAGSRATEGVPQAVVIITSSESSDDINQAELLLKQGSIYTFYIGGRDADQNELAQLSTDASFTALISEFRDIGQLQQQFLPLVSAMARREIILEPLVLSEVPDRRRDIVFLMDSSRTVKPGSFLKMREFILKVINKFPIGPNAVQVAVVQYSDTQTTEFSLNTHTTKGKLAAAVKALRSRGGNARNTGAALEYVHREHFIASSGSRKEQNVPQFLVLITSGRSADAYRIPALELKISGIMTFTVSVNHPDPVELQEIAFAPYLVFLTPTFQSLVQIPKEIITKLSTLGPPVVITEEPTITITTVTTTVLFKRDIAFLIDDSTNVGQAYFPLVRDFIIKIIQSLSIGRDGVQVAVVMYSNDARTVFYLNTYTTLSEIVAHLNGLRVKGGRTLNTGAALDYVHKNIFIKATGSRIEEGVPQMVFIITAGRSADDVGPPAEALAQEGIVTIAIGVGNADEEEVKRIAYHRHRAFRVVNFQSLDTIWNTVISSLIYGGVTEIPSALKKDIVFLIDGSVSMGQSFLEVREFLVQVAQQLDIGPDRDQMAVVRYSGVPSVEFGLDTYLTKDEVLEGIRRLVPKTGRILNTGAALDFIAKDVFSPSAGSRRDIGASQILVLIVAGKSRDDVGPAASRVKQAGIMPIAIGAKNADTAELQKIVHDSTFVLTMRNFQGLSAMQRDLLDKMATKIIIDQDDVKRDIVFVIDGSDNVRPVFAAIQKFILRMVNSLDIGGDKVRVGLVQYSEDPRAQFYLNSYTTKRDLVDVVNNLRQAGGQIANTGKALEYATQNLFTKSAGSRLEEGVPQFLILLTVSRSADDVGQAALALKEAGIAPFSIGSGDADESELLQISLSPRYSFRVDDLQNIELQQLEESLKQMKINEIKNIYTTEKRGAVQRDIVFLIDGSENVRPVFPAIQRFISNVVNSLDIGSDKVRVGLVQYSEDPRAQFYLNSYTTQRDLLDAVNNLRQAGGQIANTGKALEYVTQNIFTKSAGSRLEEGVPQFLILLTASRSADDVGQAALALKEAGVAPFSIGSGDADESELLQISLSPRYTFRVDDLQNVDLQQLQRPLKHMRIPEIKNIYTTEKRGAVQRDIVFLIDGSENVRPVFPAIQRFISSVVNSLDIGSDKVRVGLVQYSEDPRAQFYLNSYTTQRDLLDAVNNLRQAGGQIANTGKALEYVTQNIFTKSAGSRLEEGVPQFLILLTASRSADDVGQAALALKEAGVAPFSIGSGDADESELLQISLSPRYTFRVDDLQNVDLQQLQRPLKHMRIHEIKNIYTTEKRGAVQRDIVFLIDGSENVRPVFPAIQRFISSVVNSLDIGSDKVRVGLVQYSEDPRAQFYLNSYTTKRDLLDGVNNLRQVGGQIANTGKALEYVTQNIFTKSAGSRLEEGVPQFLILLTASRSADDVGQAALALKEAGVAPFSIGSGDADESELLQISLSPRFNFKVDDLQELDLQQLERSLKHMRISEITNIYTTGKRDSARRDVVFLVDGSENMRNTFPLIKNFIKTCVNNLDVESDKVRVGVIQFSEDPKANFFLNSFTTKEGVRDAIDQLSLKRGSKTNIGKALEYVTKNVFTKSAGGREEEGVPQFLILFTASRSADDVSQAVLAMKQAGIGPYSIGFADAEDNELQQISMGPKYTFKLDDPREVDTLQQELQSSLTVLDKNQIRKIIQDAPEVTQPTPQMPRRDIVFLVDGSDRAQASFPLLKTFMTNVATNLDIGRDRIRLAVVQYGDNPAPEFLLNTYTRKSDVVQAIRALKPKGGRESNTGRALEYVRRNVFTRAGGSRKDEYVPQFLILLTAGASSDDVRQAAQALKVDGVAPFTIGTRNADTTELQQISLSPDYVFKFIDLQNIESIRQYFIDPLADLETDRIIEIRDSQGANIDKRDIVFAFDGSVNARSAFPALRSFISATVDKMDVGIDAVRVAVVQYSDDARAEFLLNTHSTKREVVNAINNLQHKGGQEVRIGEVLNYVKSNVFTRAGGSRIDEGVPQFLVLLTAGKSADPVARPSLALKEAGVATIGIGSRDADDEDLRHISLSPKYTHKIPDLRRVISLQQQIFEPLTELDTVTIRQVYQQHPVETSSRDKKDIVFLIDGSNNVGVQDFAHIRDFIQNIINNLDIGTNAVRVGLAQYSNNGKTEFLLKHHTKKETLQNAIRRIRPKGGALMNMGIGLDFVMKNHFTRQAGGRKDEGVPQYLIIINGGKSRDNIQRYLGPLKNSGIHVFGIGAKNADQNELQRIATVKYGTYVVDTFQELKRVQETVKERLQLEDPNIYDTPEPPTENFNQNKADIVFILDGSINIGRQNFPRLTEFVSNIVDAIFLDDGSLQVGVVQYNSDANNEFYLNSYQTRDNVLKAIEDIVYKGGTTLNTGAALRFVKNNQFIKSAGSRIEEGVPQIAFLLIGGKSSDDAVAAATELKNAGFKIISIGVQDANVPEITQIASEPAVVFRVADMNTLSELTEQVLLATTDMIAGEGQLCPPLNEVVRSCDIDVVFGFDINTRDAFGLEPGFRTKVKDTLFRISQMRPISCTGSQSPTLRIGFSAFREDGQIRSMNLVEYQSEIMTEFDKLAATGPYIFGSSALNAYKKTFQSARSGAVKIIIHFTDGIDEDFASLKRQAETLRREDSAHALILVSLEKVTGSADVSLLEFGRGFRYRRPLSITHHDLEYELGEEIDNIAERVCCHIQCKCAGRAGDKGPQGPRGQKGSPGPKGIIGHPGYEGGAGERGPPGINGTQGFQGCQGLSGFKGTFGYPGEKGQMGELGLDGIDGEQGAYGTVGKSGEIGNPGTLGSKGARGLKGERGDLGYRGDPGEPGITNNQKGTKGQMGDTGLVGDSGGDGRPGSRGPPGIRGSQGRRGAPGTRGGSGNPGTAGPPGLSGFRGPQGEPGSNGAPGREGVPGIRGSRGPAGAVAPNGARGKIGLNGRKGEPGDPGKKGRVGPTGPRGEMGEDGVNGIGKHGIKGRQGERGPVGPLGEKGDLGVSGVPGKVGMKGNRGRRGISGNPGDLGENGDPGYTGPQGAKGPKGRSIETCGIIRQIKDTCPCCYGTGGCPVYPTELAFVVDTSRSKTANQLMNIKNAILNIVQQLNIVEGNCPKGARVAILTYNSEIVTEIRFSGARNKRSLLEQIKNLQFVPSRKVSSIANAMLFVARNTFKRVRSGILMRKVAVFFSDGQTKPKDLNDAITKLASEDIISVYLSPREDDNLNRALQKNDAGISQAFVFRNDNDTLSKVMACHICLDFCEVNTACDSKLFRNKRSVAPTDIDLDIAFILDSSATINPTQFVEIKRYITYVADQLVISKDPATSNHQARVAVVQQALYDSQTNDSLNRVKTEFSLTDHRSSQDIGEYIQNKMTQLEGTRATAHAVEWTVKNIFEKAPQPRQFKLIALMTTGDLSEAEKEQLETVVVDAKCKGFFVVIVKMFKKLNGQDLMNLASEPQDVYFKSINEISELHSEDLLRFARQLPKYIRAEDAFHLSQELQKRCGSLQSDQPSEMFGNADQQVTADVSMAAEKLMGMELFASSVTEDSIVLRFSQAEAQHRDSYEVTVVEVSQSLLVAKLNVSDPEIVIKDLETGEQYRITVIGFSESRAKSIYSGLFTTKKSSEAITGGVTTQVIMEPIENPETDRCMLDFDAGSQCSDYSAKWFFDSKNNICTQFWYGGCDGNGNRFHTEAECNAECMKSLPEASISVPEPEGLLSAKDKCQLPRNEGTCRNFSLKWYYDVKTETCSRFWYGGCNGNENRFNTQDECSKTCFQGRVQTEMITTMGT